MRARAVAFSDDEIGARSFTPDLLDQIGSLQCHLCDSHVCEFTRKKVKIHNSINIKIIFHHVSYHLLLFVVTFSFSLCARSNVHATCDMHKHDAVTSMFGLGASNSSNNNNSSHIYLVHFILSSYNDSFGESSMFVICLSNALNT